MSEKKQFTRKDDNLYLEDILNAISKIEKYVNNLDFNSFKENEMATDAVIRNLLIIGEAVKNISSVAKEKNKEIEWKKIAGLRDVLIHAYSGINFEILWDIIKNKIPELKTTIKKMYSK